MSPICRSKWDFSYWLPWKLSRLCKSSHEHPASPSTTPTAGLSERGRCGQICHWCMRPGKIQRLLAWQCWPGLSINEEQMQFAKHIELIRVTTRRGWSHFPKSRRAGRGDKADFKLEIRQTALLEVCSGHCLYHNHLRSFLKTCISGSNCRPAERVSAFKSGEPSTFNKPPGDAWASWSLRIPLGRKQRQEYF